MACDSATGVGGCLRGTGAGQGWCCSHSRPIWTIRRNCMNPTCIQCEADKYKPAPGNHACDTCPQYTSAPAASTTVLVCVCDPRHRARRPGVHTMRGRDVQRSRGQRRVQRLPPHTAARRRPATRWRTASAPPGTPGRPVARAPTAQQTRPRPRIVSCVTPTRRRPRAPRHRPRACATRSNVINP